MRRIRPEVRAARSRPEPIPRSVGVLTVALGCLGVAGGLMANRFAGQPERSGSVAVLLLLGTLIVAGLLQLHFRYRNHVEALDLFEAVVAPLIVALPGLGTVVVVAVAKAISQAILKVRPAKALFNTAQWSAAAAAGTLVFGLARTGGPLSAVDLLPLVLAVLSVTAVNQLAFVSVLCLVDHRPVREVLAELRPVVIYGWIVGGAVMLTFGILFTAAFSWAPATVVLFAAPLWLLHWASRSYGIGLAHRARLRGLQRATHTLAVPVDARETLPQFLDEVRACFGAEIVELVTCDDGGLTSRAVGGDQGASGPLPPVDSPARGTLLSELMEGRQTVDLRAGPPHAGTARLLAQLGLRDCLAAPVFAGERVIGLLCVYNRSGFAGSEEGETGVITALAGEVGSALEKGRLLDTLSAEREKLLDSEARFRVLVQDSSDMVCVVDASGTLSYSSPAFSRLVGRDAAEVGRCVFAAAHPDDRVRAEETLRRCAATPGARSTLECRLKTPAGTWRHVETLLQNLLDQPAIKGIVLNSRDITERKRADILVSGQARVLESIARGAPLDDTLVALIEVVEAQLPDVVAAVFLADTATGVRTRAAPTLPRAVLEELDGILAEPASGDGSPPLWPLTRPEIIADLDRKPGSLLFATARSRGFRAVWVIPIPAPDGAALTGALALYRRETGGPDPAAWRLVEVATRLADVAIDRIQAQADLAHQATHDILTGLPNRLLFSDRLAAATARGMRRESAVAVMFIDLDRFKAVNDGMGHDAGDKLLIECARRLERSVRPWDTVARFGGDEFTILCEDVQDESAVSAVAARIREALSLPVHLPAGEVFVRASIGIAMTSHALHIHPEGLLDNADRAMYQAKRQGGDCCVFFDHKLQSRMRHRLAVQTELHHAIERRQFRLFYQPIISIRSGVVVGAEALLRWRHPERGILAPADFIHEAEETGLIVDIGHFVIEQAIRQAVCWRQNRRSSSPLTVSINLSALQFTRHDLVDVISRTLQRSGADPSTIHFEITESILMDDIESTAVALNRLKALGVGLMIDDFGTGYSSLSYLKRFPVDGLKIDRSFVQGLGSDSGDSAIVAAVVNLAHTLGLVAVAEGVETAEQLVALEQLQCDFAQGYYLAYPQPADDVCPRQLERVNG